MNTYLQTVSMFFLALWHYLTRGRLLYACDVMNQLNRWARHRRNNDTAYLVYKLKNRLTQWLYEAGFCIEARKQIQNIECLGYGFMGCAGRECGKCRGTGVFRTHTLYAFTFELQDKRKPTQLSFDELGVHAWRPRRYRWHQPESLVDWPVTLTTQSVSEYDWPPIKEESDLSDDQALALALVIWWALVFFDRAPAIRLFDPFYPAAHFSHNSHSWFLRLWLWVVSIDLGSHTFVLDFPFTRTWDIGHRRRPGRNPDWVYIQWRRYAQRLVRGRQYEFSVRLFGYQPREFIKRIRVIATCFLVGHNWVESHDGEECQWCGKPRAIVDPDEHNLTAYDEIPF